MNLFDPEDEDCFFKTRRAYFAAHAPAEPWPFFEPVMPQRPPLGPPIDEEGRTYPDRYAADKAVGEEWHFSNQAAVNEWEAEKRRQRFIQWPWFYADTMIDAHYDTEEMEWPQSTR